MQFIISAEGVSTSRANLRKWQGSQEVLSVVLTLIDTGGNDALSTPQCNFFILFLFRSLSLKITKDVDQEARCSHVSRMPTSPSAECPLLGVEENGGVDSLPFRLMLQECTAVKTLLLKMKRVLQEVGLLCSLRVSLLACSRSVDLIASCSVSNILWHIVYVSGVLLSLSFPYMSNE